MSATLVLSAQAIRERAIAWINRAPINTRIEFKAPKRTIPQNDKMWAMLTEVSCQKAYHGVRLLPEDWKLIFMDGLGHELRMVPNLAGTGFVNLGRSSSNLSKEEMADLIELITAWGVSNGVIFRDQAEAA